MRPHELVERGAWRRGALRTATRTWASERVWRVNHYAQWREWQGSVSVQPAATNRAAILYFKVGPSPCALGATLISIGALTRSAPAAEMRTLAASANQVLVGDS